MTQPPTDETDDMDDVALCPVCGARFTADEDGSAKAGDHLADHLTDEHDAFSRVMVHGVPDPTPGERGHLSITLPAGVTADVTVEPFRRADE